MPTGRHRADGIIRIMLMTSEHGAGEHGRLVALVALKRSEVAKSRLGSLPDPLRRRLAWTMALDTLRALAAVLPVIVISNQPGIDARLRGEMVAGRVLAESHSVGINAALQHGERAALAAGFRGVLASVGDLPSLRADSVRAVLAAAEQYPRAFLADTSGTGTTMLTAIGADLQPHFQGRSAAAHRASGAIGIGTQDLGRLVPDARRDVDSDVDLADAVRLGLGPSTAQLFHGDQLGQYTVITVADQRPDGSSAAVTGDGYRVNLPAGAARPQLARLAAGQRLHAVVVGDQVLSAWLY
jgi:2-phospho-L-lactate/phosphoenolpyruvate guanylyltransferase